jgi:hypothetical protein
VLTVGGAASVAAKEQFVARLEGSRDHIRRREDRRHAISGDPLL